MVLEQIEHKRRIIANKKYEINQLLSLIQNSPSNGHLKGRIKEQAQNIMNEIQDAEEFIEEQSIKISSLPNERMQDVLKMRYFENMTWENIGQCMGITYQWCITLHNRALKELGRM